MLSQAEENYLKAVYHLSDHGKKTVSTNGVADMLQTKPASVSDMLQKLAAKRVIHYIKYKGVTLTESGITQALLIIRNHRLWEVFLVEKLKFNWDEVHDVAEQLEHIKSSLLIERLDEFLEYPQYDPHGDPIPDKNGKLELKKRVLLEELPIGKSGIVVRVKESSPVFLQYLDKIGVRPGTKITVKERVEFDGSLEIQMNESERIIVSKEVSKNLYIAEQ